FRAPPGFGGSLGRGGGIGSEMLGGGIGRAPLPLISGGSGADVHVVPLMEPVAKRCGTSDRREGAACGRRAR
ncbi:MAG: hypothetical protein AAFY72_13340, partial [Cyanobacteria bacterium J06649_4]